MVSCIMLAAGEGHRFGHKRKQFEIVNGKTVLQHAMELYDGWIDEMIVVTPPAVVVPLHWSEQFSYVVSGCEGGPTRFHSIGCGLEKLHLQSDITLIADAVRANTPPRIIGELIRAIRDEGYQCAVPAIPPANMVVVVDQYGQLGPCTLPTSKTNLRRLESPMSYDTSVLRAAHYKARIRGLEYGWGMIFYIQRFQLGQIKAIEGDPANFKITYPLDLCLFKEIKSPHQGI